MVCANSICSRWTSTSLCSVSITASFSTMDLEYSDCALFTASSAASFSSRSLSTSSSNSASFALCSSNCCSFPVLVSASFTFRLSSVSVLSKMATLVVTSSNTPNASSSSFRTLRSRSSASTRASSAFSAVVAASSSSLRTFSSWNSTLTMSCSFSSSSSLTSSISPSFCAILPLSPSNSASFSSSWYFMCPTCSSVSFSLSLILSALSRSSASSAADACVFSVASCFRSSSNPILIRSSSSNRFLRYALSSPTFLFSRLMPLISLLVLRSRWSTRTSSPSRSLSLAAWTVAVLPRARSASSLPSISVDVILTSDRIPWWPSDSSASRAWMRKVACACTDSNLPSTSSSCSASSRHASVRLSVSSL
mmetsp:Transcript_34651/g.73819  ORF Transcript_34651/g.73819 Transcript_34651/m.73819 type:complete len:366 (+) Transcript_34651:1778-2875(+)